MIENKPLIGFDFKEGGGGSRNGFYVYMLKYMTFTKFNPEALSSLYSRVGVMIGYYPFHGTLSRVLYIKSQINKKKSKNRKNKKKSESIALHRGLELARFSPLFLMSRDTQIVKVMGKSHVIDEMSGHVRYSVFHESLLKNQYLVLEDDIEEPLLGHHGDKGLASPSIGLLVTAMTSGITRHAYEYHAAVAQDLLSLYLLEPGIDDNMVASALTALYTDILLYFVTNIIHYKHGGTLGGELSQSIAAIHLQPLRTKVASPLTSEQAAKYADEILSQAGKAASQVLKALKSSLGDLRGNIEGGSVETVAQRVRELKNCIDLIEEGLDNAALSLLGVERGKAKGAGRGSEPLIGRLDNLLRSLSRKLASPGGMGEGSSSEAGEPDAECDGLVVTVTGQWSGNQLRLIERLVLNGEGERWVYVGFTPYSLVNAQHILDVYESASESSELALFPVTQGDLRYNYLVARNIARKAPSKGVRRLCAVLQGPSQIVYPVAAGLYAGASEGNIKLDLLIT